MDDKTATEISEELFEKITGKKYINFIPNWEHACYPDKIILKISQIDEIMQRECENDYANGSMGDSHYIIDFFAVTKSGGVLNPPRPHLISSSNYAYSEDIEESGCSLQEAWGNQDDIKFIVEYHYDYSNWVGMAYRCNTTLTLYILY